jgi:5-methyltetrahydropteroyltriglutamate--homocysteine methyltransferase
MEKLFPTQEIGSLSKPAWLIKGLRKLPLSEEDFHELDFWAKKLDLHGYGKIKSPLKKGSVTEKKLRDFAALFNIKFFEKAGLDFVYDGEARRIEMYEYPIRRIKGMKILGWVRSFDNKYYRKASCIDKPTLEDFYHLEEFEFVRDNATRNIKVPITGPYTLADWSFNEYYESRLLNKIQDFRRRKKAAKRDFVFDLAKEVIRPNICSLVKAGAKWIQIDEPAATTHPDEITLFIEAFNEAVEGINCKFSVHICYSDYSLLYPEILDLKVDHLALEYANRKNYDDLKFFKEYGDKREIGLGVLDVHSNEIESPEIVRDRLLYAHNFLEENKIYANPDCGLRTRSLEVSFEKLSNLVAGAQLAREALS